MRSQDGLRLSRSGHGMTGSEQCQSAPDQVVEGSFGMGSAIVAQLTARRLLVSTHSAPTPLLWRHWAAARACGAFGCSDSRSRILFNMAQPRHSSCTGLLKYHRIVDCVTSPVSLGLQRALHPQVLTRGRNHHIVCGSSCICRRLAACAVGGHVVCATGRQ